MPTPLVLRHCSQLEPPARQAVEVLADSLPRLTGRPVQPVADLESPTRLVIGETPSGSPDAALAQVQHDGYVLWPGQRGLLLAAHNAKGLLNAAYGYLAWLGVLWPKPGVEIIPQRAKLHFPREPILRTPAFSRRGVFHSQSPAEWPQWCEFYARLQFNEVSVHGAPGHWDKYRQVAERYGITLQLGGHGLSSLLPREEFSAHPDYFRALQPPDFDRARQPDSNLCPGSPEGLALVRRNACEYAKAAPGARVYHLWADDLPAGGWCYCSRCMGLPPQDQAILASNAVAEGVCLADPQAKTAHLIYHDTLEPPRVVKPHPALVPLYAPRERCYAHALNDPACARNRWHRENLERVLDYFGRREWLLFEYYSDYILFRAMLPVMPEVVAADLKYYREQGLDCAQHLLVGTVVGLLLNLHVFAELAWDLDADPWAPLKRLAKEVPGLLPAWRLQAKASYRWLDLSDWPLDRYFDYRFLIERPVRQSRACRRQVLRAARDLDAAWAALPADLLAWAERERLSLETSAGICRQMEAQMEMLEELGRCAGREDRWEQAGAAYRRAVNLATPIGKAFRRAGLPKAYFFGLERLLETIWREKVTGRPKRACR